MANRQGPPPQHFASPRQENHAMHQEFHAEERFLHQQNEIRHDQQIIREQEIRREVEVRHHEEEYRRHEEFIAIRERQETIIFNERPRVDFVAVVPAAAVVNINIGRHAAPPPPPPPEAAYPYNGGGQQNQGQQSDYTSPPPPLGGENAKALKDELNAFKDQTHLKFKVDGNGNLEADAKDFRKLTTEQQNTIFPQDGSFKFDADHNKIVVANTDKGQLDWDVDRFKRNAAAIGEAVKGHGDQAIALMDARDRPQQATPPQSDIQQQGGQPGGELQSDGTRTSPAQQTAPKQEEAPPPPAPPEPVQHTEPKAPPVPDITQAAPAPVDPSAKLNQKDLVGEAQEILKQFFSKTVKLDGIDTLKKGGQGQTDQALSDVLKRTISDGMTQGDLNELETKAKITDAQKADILKDVRAKLHLPTPSAEQASVGSQTIDPAALAKRANELNAALGGKSGEKDSGMNTDPRIVLIDTPKVATSQGLSIT